MVVGGTYGLFLVGLVLSRALALPYPPVSSTESADYAGDEAVDIFLRQTRKHARPMFYINCGYRDLCYCYSKVTRHHYCCSCDVGACFPAYARVSTPGGAHTTMDRLRTGDKVLAVDESGHVVTSTILGFMDRRPKETALYVTLRTSIGRNLTLSPNHVLFKSSPNSSQPISVFGSDINIGDVIFSANETGLQRTEVVGIDHDVTIGAYVPLTKEGTLVVDGTFVSCYASYRHSLAHVFMAPVRSFPLLLRPRPGLLLSMAAFVRDSAADTMGSFLDLLDVLSGTSKGAILQGSPAWSPSGAALKQNRSLEEGLLEEGEGESYYVSLVKLVGWAAFRGERAPQQVLQVNPQPDGGLLQAMKIRSMFSSLPSLLGALAKSW